MKVESLKLVMPPPLVECAALDGVASTLSRGIVNFGLYSVAKKEKRKENRVLKFIFVLCKHIR